MASLLSWLGKRAKAVEAQLNPFDGGKTYNTVVNNQQPAPAPQRPQTDTRNVLSKAYDQVNPFDSGRTYKNNTPFIPDPVSSPDKLSIHDFMGNNPNVNKLQTGDTVNFWSGNAPATSVKSQSAADQFKSMNKDVQRKYVQNALDAAKSGDKNALSTLRTLQAKGALTENATNISSNPLINAGRAFGGGVEGGMQQLATGFEKTPGINTAANLLLKVGNDNPQQAANEAIKTFKKGAESSQLANPTGAGNVLNVAGNMTPALVASTVNPTAGITAAYGQGTGVTYDALRNAGMSDAKSRLGGVTGGALMAIPTYLGMKGITNPNALIQAGASKFLPEAASNLVDRSLNKLGSNAVTNFVTNRVLQAPIEYATGAANQVGQNVAMNVGGVKTNVLANVPEAAKQNLVQAELMGGASDLVKSGLPYAANKLSKTPWSKEDLQRRQDLVVGYNEAKAKGKNLAADLFSKQIDSLDRAHQSAGQRLGNVVKPLNKGGYIAGPLALDFSKAKAEGKVFEGVDGKPRFEVDDSGAKINVGKLKSMQLDEKIQGYRPLKLSEVLDHNELYKQYPELKNTTVKLDYLGKDTAGSYNPTTNTLSLDSTRAKLDPEGTKATILHEIQHSIQNIEGFAAGGELGTVGNFDPTEVADMYKVNSIIDGVKNGKYKVSDIDNLDVGNTNFDVKTWAKNLIEAGDKEIESFKNNLPIKNYRNLAGEAEARAVQARMNMPMSERYVAPKTKAGDYVGSHQAPTRGDGDYHAPASDVTGGAGMFPDDIYTDPMAYRYYGHGGDAKTIAMDKKSIELIKSIKGNPDAEVTIYRAVPAGKTDKINAGDWVTLNKDYAQMHNNSQFDGKGIILEQKVKADELYTDGNSIHEFGYDPRPKPRSTFYDSLDVPKEDLIVRNEGGKAMSVETDPLESLKQEALKYKSAEEFANSLNAMKSGTVTGVGNLPISKINKTQVKALTERGLPHTDTNLKVSDFKPGRKITQPLEVYSKGNSWVVENGNHRLAQALANGDETVPVVFKRGEGGAYSTPITDFYNQAHAKPQAPEAPAPQAPQAEAPQATVAPVEKTVDPQEQARKQFQEDWEAKYGKIGESKKTVQKTALDKANEQRATESQIRNERQKLLKERGIKEPTTRSSSEDIAKYNEAVTKINKELEAKYSIDPLEALKAEASSVSKFGWGAEATPQGTKLFNRNGKHVATITQKNGRFTASYADGQRIATGADANKLAEDVARKTFYAQELPQNTGGTLRPDKTPEPFKNTAQQGVISPERANATQSRAKKETTVPKGVEAVKTNRAPRYGVKRPELEGKLSPEDALIQAGIDSGHNGLAGTGKGTAHSAKLSDLTASQRDYVMKSATSYMLSGDPVFQERVRAYARGDNQAPKPKSQFEQNLEDAGVKPKGFILKETKGRAGRKDTVRVAPDGKGGLKATRQTEDVINPDAPDFLQVNKNDVPVTPSTSKYSAPKLPIDNPQSRLRPQSDMTAVPLENTGVTRFNEAAPRQIKGRVKKDAVVKSVLGEISKSKGKGNVEASIIAADLTTKAKRLGVKLDRKFIDKYQAGALDTPAEKQMGAFIKQVTDELFRKQQALDPTIQYRKNYIPQSYAQDAATVEEATKRLAKTTGAANRRTFNTYKEAESFGLTPRDKNLEQMLGHAASKVEQVAQNRKVVQKGMEGGIFTTNQSGGTPLMGVFAPDGSQLYAKKQVADVINGVLQKDSTGLAKAIAKTAHAFGVAQDVMLQGGVPGTNANFFVTGQMVKDTTRNIGKAPLHPIQATKQEGHLLGDFFRGNKGTQKRFAEGTFKAGGKQIKNSDFVRQMADRGLYIQPQTKLTGEGKNIVARGWNKLGNNPTFGRYMPNRMLSTAQEVYAQSVKKLGHEKALDLAAETTKTFTGHVDTILKGRSGLTEDVAGIFLFAPKYRESILYALFNVIKSTYPTNWRNPNFKPSRQLLAGMAVTLGAYELLNRQTTGHSMMQNRPGQELSVEIPYGEKDEKGNQKVINIPFMPGFMTIPRAAFSAANALRKGDAKGVIAEAGKALSAPMEYATAIIGNRDYSGNPIYIDKATAEKEGVSPDSAFTASKKIGGYLFGQLSPSWVRGGQQLAAGKPKEQAIATALEAPLKFGKRLNPDTVAYFDRRDKFTATLNKNEKAMFDKINPSKKNIRGEDIKDEGTLVKASNYADLIAHPEFADKYQAYQKSAPSHDPLWDLNKNQLRSYMQAQVISKNNPGGDGNTVRQLYDRLPKDFFATREKYFADLKKKGVKFDSKNKPNPGMPDKLVAFSEAYHKLPYGTGARKAALNSQTGKEYIAWLEQNKIRNNQERADLGLPPLEDKGSSYGGYSKGGGGGGRKGGGGGGRKGSGTAKLASVLKASNAAIKPPAKPKSPGIKVKTSNVPTTFKKAPLKKYAVAKVTVGKSRR